MSYPTSTAIPENLVSYCLGRARALLADGVEYLAVKNLLEAARADGVVMRGINNSISPHLARQLIAREPRLDGVILTKALGKQVKSNNADLKLVLADLSRRPGVKVAGLRLIGPDGIEIFADIATVAARLRAAAQKAGR